MDLIVSISDYDIDVPRGTWSSPGATIIIQLFPRRLGHRQGLAGGEGSGFSVFLVKYSCIASSVGVQDDGREWLVVRCVSYHRSDTW